MEQLLFGQYITLDVGIALQVVVADALTAEFTRVRERPATTRALVFFALLNAGLLITIWVVRLVDGSIPRFF